MAEGFLLIPPLVAGFVIGIYEIILIHRDVSVATHRFMHGLHAMVVGIIATICVFNVPFVYELFPAITTWPLMGNEIVFRIAIGLVMIIKIHGASAALKSSGMSSAGMAETWTHSVLIGALVVASPYIYPMISPMLPGWMQMPTG